MSGDGDRRHQDGPGPADDGRADAPPTLGAHGPAGFEQTEMAADDQQGRRQGQRRHHCDEDADSGGNTKALEIRAAG